MSMITTREYNSVAEMKAAYKNSAAALRHGTKSISANDLSRNINAPTVTHPIGGISSIPFIKIAVCDVFDITHDELIGKKGSHKYLIPRHIAIAMSRKMSNRSFPQIGAYFGGRDHSTIISAVTKLQPIIDEVSARLSQGASYKDWITEMKKTIDKRRTYVQIRQYRKGEQSNVSISQ